jgi:single-strand DNA-binding protein
MNRVTLVGRLTAKPELRYTGSNLPYARFTVAVNRTFRNNDGQADADFISVIVWRKQAENVCNFLDKGRLVSVDGRLQTGSYTDKDGNRRYTTDVVADSVQFLEGKNSRMDVSNEPSPYDYQDAPSEVNVSDDPFADFGDSVSIDDNFLD